MSKSFTESLKLQRIETHTKLLFGKGYWLDDKTEDKRKLHDLFCWLTDTWVEAKTDYSGFTERLLVEYKANVPASLLTDLPLRTPLPFAKVFERFDALDRKYDALATDDLNLEPKHLLSYYFAKTQAHYVVEVQRLRELVKANRYDFIVVGNPTEHWQTVAVIVPVMDLPKPPLLS